MRPFPSGKIYLKGEDAHEKEISDGCTDRMLFCRDRCLRCFVVACVFVLLYGYNRIHMTNHFLTDVCFGTIIIFPVIIKAAERKSSKTVGNDGKK